MQLKIIKGDISTIECDAIVCSTSLNLSPIYPMFKHELEAMGYCFLEESL